MNKNLLGLALISFSCLMSSVSAQPLQPVPPATPQTLADGLPIPTSPETARYIPGNPLPILPPGAEALNQVGKPGWVPPPIPENPVPGYTPSPFPTAEQQAEKERLDKANIPKITPEKAAQLLAETYKPPASLFPGATSIPMTAEELARYDSQSKQTQACLDQHRDDKSAETICLLRIEGMAEVLYPPAKN